MAELSERRDVLLDTIVDSLLRDGIADLSLRPLAERVGTSARLLIYHFETKEKLLACALAAVRARVETALSELAARKRPQSTGDALTMFWEWATEKRNQKYFRLLFEVDGLSMYRPARDAGGDALAVWMRMIARATRDDQAPERATLIMGALNGLLQDFLSSGDKSRTTAALQCLIAMLEYPERRKRITT